MLSKESKRGTLRIVFPHLKKWTSSQKEIYRCAELFPGWAETGTELRPDYTTEGFEPLRLRVQVFYPHCNLSDGAPLSSLAGIPTGDTTRLFDQLPD